jgi:predicted GIY-YIG superfamily endonuclease
MKTFYIYLMTNRSRTVLYTGVTNSLEGRLVSSEQRDQELYQNLSGRPPRLLRAIRRASGCHQPRKRNQRLASRKEKPPGPNTESKVEGSGTGAVRHWQRESHSTRAMRVTRWERLRDRYATARSLGALRQPRDDKHVAAPALASGKRQYCVSSRARRLPDEGPPSRR